MKKKIFISTVTTVALGTIAIPTIASCSNKNKTDYSNYFELETKDNDVILSGFKKGMTPEQITKAFDKTLVIPAKVTKIAKNAFYDSTNKVSLIPITIRTLSFEANTKINSIDFYAFKSSPFEQIELPACLTELNGASFEHSYYLKEVNFQTPLDGKPIKIGSSVFSNCSSLEKVNFPKNRNAYTGDMIFAYCPKLKYIDLTQITDTIKLSNDIFYKSATETGAEIHIDCDVKAAAWEEYLSKQGLVFSGSNPCQFKYNVQLFNIAKDSDSNVVLHGWSNSPSRTEENMKKYLVDTLYIPNNVNKIADNAFYQASTNASTIPSFITKLSWDTTNSKLHTIGANAFNSWTGLTKLAINNRVKTIGDSAFANCSNVNELDLTGWRCVLPDVSKWGNNIFQNFATNGTVKTLVNAQQEKWKTFIATKGINYTNWTHETTTKLINFDDTAKELKGFDESLTHEDINKIYQGQTSMTIPNDTKTIGSYAFYKLDSSESTMPASVTDLDLTNATALTTIKKYAFEKSGLSSVLEIPDTLETIENNAFELSWLDTFNFTNIKTIGSSAFSQTKFTTIDLSSSAVTKIGHSAFANIDTMQTFKFPTTGNALTLEDYALAFNDNLETVENWPASLTTTGKGTFNGCKFLNENSIQAVLNSANITTIGNYCFTDCNKLTAVKIPSHVTTIEEGAFKNCKSLTSIDLSEISASIPTGFLSKYVFAGLPAAGTITIHKDATTQQQAEWQKYFEDFGLTFSATNWKLVLAQ